MNFEFNLPSGFKVKCLKMLTDRWQMDAGVTGFLLAHS